MKEKILSKINPKIVVPIAVGAVLAVVGITALAVSLLGRGGSVNQAQATEIALAHAGVAQEDTTSLSVREDEEEDRQVYEIDFSTQDTAYHYDVARNNGEIVNYNYDKNGTAPVGENQDDSGQEGVKTQEATPAPERAAATITEESAKTIALEHAGVTEASFHRVELDTEDGREVYEVEFYTGNTEYDYTIARDTGEILSYDSDIEGWGVGNGQGNGNGNGNGNGQQNGKGNSVSSSVSGPITLEEAVQLVLDRVPGASSEDVRIEQDRDDGRDVYEGEVYCNRTEHEFTIDASTGDFIEWSVDYQE